MKFPPARRLAPAVVLDGVTTAIIACDHQMHVASINTAAENLFAVSRGHVLGLPIWQGIPHFDACRSGLTQALENTSGFIERELHLSRSGDHPITVDLTVTPVTLSSRVGLVLEVQSLDRQLRISRDESLLAQHEASRELIRGLAHEIKNPLGGIRGAAQLLERDFPDHEHREYTRVIIREVDRLQNLVNRMLGPNRVPKKTLLNIHEVTEHVRKLVDAEAPSNVQITRDYDPSIPNLLADREQLVQATLNLVRNALQALDGQGHIILRTRARRQLTLGATRHRLVIQMDVEDNGPGINPAMLEKIFYPMVTTRAEGTGLGLPMAQYLVHGHGGLIECTSREGRTIFSVFLPLQTSA